MIDWDKLRRLRFDIGQNAFEDVVAQFLAESEAAIGRLESLTLPQAIATELDFLKSMALSLGFAPLADLCEDGLERLTETGFRVDLNPIRDAYHACRAELWNKAAQVLAR